MSAKVTEAPTVDLLNRPEIHRVATSVAMDKGPPRARGPPNSVDVEEPYHHHELVINNKVKTIFQENFFIDLAFS